PADAHVPSQPKEGALGDVVVAPGRPLSQPARAVRSAHPAHRDGEAVDDGEGRVTVNLLQQVAPERLFHPPQISRLPSKGRAVHLPQLWKPRPVVPPKVVKQLLLGAQSQNGADHLDGQHFAVGQSRLRAPLTQPERLPLIPIVNECEHTHDKCVKIHSWRPPTSSVVLSPTKRREVSFFLSTPRRKLAHGVSIWLIAILPLIHRPAHGCGAAGGGDARAGERLHVVAAGAVGVAGELA